MESQENNNLKALRFACLFLIILGLSLYFKSLNSPAGAVRSYFLLGFTILFLIFGIAFSDYTYISYKKYFHDCVLKFVIYSTIYLIFSLAVILISVFLVKNNLKFTTNVSTAINNTNFLFTNFWFVPTGLIILLAMPVLNKTLKKANYSPAFFMSIILALVLIEVIAPLIPNNVLSLRDVFSSLNYIIFYGFFTLIGLSHKQLLNKLEKNRVIVPCFIFVCSIIIAACLIIYGYSYDLHKQFYPPTFFLTIYHLFVLAFFCMFAFRLKPLSNLLSDKKLVKFTSDYLLEIVFAMPILLYLISLLFNTLEITEFFSKYFIVGFLVYFLYSVSVLILSYLIKYLVDKTQKNKKTAPTLF